MLAEYLICIYMKNFFKTTLDIILFFPRWGLGIMMMLLPAVPVYWIAGEIFSVNMRGYGPGSNDFEVFLFGVIGVALILYTIEHTRWGEWTKKMFGYGMFDDYPDD